MTTFGIQAFKLNNVVQAGARGQQFDRNRDFDSDGADGTVHETFHAIKRGKPAAEFASTALKTLVTALSGSTDLPLLALDGTNGLVMYGAKALASAPGYAAGTVHHARTGLNGVAWLSSVRWSAGGVAEAVIKVMFLSTDGRADPISISTIALPAQTVPVELFTESALVISGATIDTLFSAELQFDPKFDYDFSGGLPYPILVTGGGARGRCSHRLMVDIADPTVLEGTGAVSLAFTSLAQGGTLGASTVTFTLNNPWSVEDSFGGPYNTPQGRRMIVRPRWDGTTKPVTWATT